MLIIAIVGLLRKRLSVCKKIVTSNQINSTLYHIQLAVDEKAQPDSYIRRTAL